MNTRRCENILRPVEPEVVSSFEGAFGIDEHVGDILDVTDFPFAAPDLEQRVVGGAVGVGRIEQQHSPEAAAPSGGQHPILSLDVMDDGRAWPGQQRRHNEADAPVS
jgi:hypothetical protein